MNNICFVCNGFNTYFYLELSKFLDKNKIFWIVFNVNHYEAIRECFSNDNILYIRRSDIKKSKENNNINYNNIDYKFNELLLTDRRLKYEMSFGLDFLNYIANKFYSFIKKNHITLVLGEITYAHEILFSRITKQNPELNCRYLLPATVRYPSDRFAFFTDEFQENMIRNPKVNNFEVIDLCSKPEYYKINNIILKNKFKFKNRIRRLLRFFYNPNFDKEDITLINSKFYRSLKAINEEVNPILYKYLVKKKSLKELLKYRYLVYALHKQPEASIDVVGRYYENQYNNIVNIWRILPDKYKLVVKEHTNAIGDRNLSFYRNILKLPNIYIVDEKVDSFDLVKNSAGVFTVSGTIAFEAAYQGIISFTFAPVFFNKLKNCHRITLDELRYCQNYFDLVKRCQEHNKNKKDIIEFSKYLYQHSFEGKIGDPISNPSCMDKENIIKVVNAIKAVCS